MNAVRSVVFKRKSMVTVLRPLSAVPLLPQEFLYNEVGLNLMTHGNHRTREEYPRCCRSHW